MPDPRYPFLGVHFTSRVDGELDVGPNAVLALAREGYRRRDVSPARPLANRRLAGHAGRWPASTGGRASREMRGSLSHVGRSSPRPGVTCPRSRRRRRAGAAGVRAQAVDADGTLVDDFRIHRLGPVVTVRNAPSPAATSSLAIADHVAEQVLGAG